MFDRYAWLAAASLTCLAAPLPGAAQEIADRIFTGGPVLTMDDGNPRADAVAVRDGRIIAVGPEAEVMALAGDGTEVTDLAGRALIPGFYDAHAHVMMGGLQALSANLLAPPDGEVTDIASLQRRAARLDRRECGDRRGGEPHHRLRLRQRDAGRTPASDARRSRRDLDRRADLPGAPVRAFRGGELEGAGGGGNHRRDAGPAGRA